MVVTLERTLVTEQFVERDSQRPDIAALVSALAVDLLRRHVPQCSHENMGLSLQGIGDAGDSKVHDLDVAVLREHYVSRFDVAMDDAALMGIIESAAYRHYESDFLQKAQRRMGFDNLLQTLSL